KHKVCGSDAEHGVRIAVHRDLLPDQTRIAAESALPQSKGDDRYTIASGLILGLSKEAPACRRNIEERKEVSGYPCTDEPFRLVFAGEVQDLKMVRAYITKDFLFVLPLEKVGAGDGASLDGRLHSVHVNKPVRVSVGKRAKQHAVDDTEDGGVGSDAKRKGYHCDDSEAGLLKKHARRVANVF